MCETIARVDERLRDFDGYQATRAIESFVEDLSNWYVRRSRRRFWDGDAAALDALYDVLVGLARLLAPILPFTAEELYQNLVAGPHAAQGAPASVHHCSWPALLELDEDDRQALADMAMVKRLAGLGRAARSAADLKLRQPLARANIALRSEAEAVALERLGGHLLDELNVKALEVARDEGDLVRYSLKPVFPMLGPKYGKRVPAIGRALGSLDAGAAAAALKAGQNVELDVDGETLSLEPSEIEILAVAREGLATEEDAGYVVGLETELSQDLLDEGMARDLVRLVQSLRKDSGLAVSDRIQLWISGDAGLIQAAQTWQDYIAGETLAEQVSFELPEAGMVPVGQAASEVDGRKVQLVIAKHVSGT